MQDSFKILINNISEFMGQEQPKGPVVPEKTLKGIDKNHRRASQGIH